MTYGELTLRTAPCGGQMRTAVHLDVRPEAADTWLVFIHGFNVSAGSARLQVETLRDLSMGKFLWGHESVAWVLFLWPSDRTVSNVLNKITYPGVRDTADRAGALLGGYLATQNDRRLVLVGHSLGAQVALKAANRIAVHAANHPVTPGPRRAGLALLAAAVRTQAVDEGGDFPDSLADREVVTVNPQDTVLRRAFGPGERLASLFRGRSVAVGLSGDPAARSWERVRLKGRKHDVYSDPDCVPALASVVGRHMLEPAARRTENRVVESRLPQGRRPR